MQSQGVLGIERMCQATGVSRAGFYRGWEEKAPDEAAMREDNLLAVRRRKFIVTTDSDHEFLVYPNLARYMVLTAVNQLWVADITYIRLASEFVYFAAVLDAFSRRALGWSLRRSL